MWQYDNMILYFDSIMVSRKIEKKINFSKE